MIICLVAWIITKDEKDQRIHNSDSVANVSTLRRQTKSCDSICLVLVAKEIHCTYCRILNICQCDGSILIDFGISFQQQICQWDVLIFDLHSLVYGWNNFL